MSWPPTEFAAVKFHDEMIELLSLGPSPNHREEMRQVGMPPEGNANIRNIRIIRFPKSRQRQYVEIEFVDPNGQSYMRRYPAADQVSARDDRVSNFEADRSADPYSERAAVVTGPLPPLVVMIGKFDKMT